VQALCRDLMAEAVVRTEKAGMPVVLTVHDELLCEVPEAQAKAELERLHSLMLASPSGRRGCQRRRVDGRVSQMLYSHKWRFAGAGPPTHGTAASARGTPSGGACRSDDGGPMIVIALFNDAGTRYVSGEQRGSSARPRRGEGRCPRGSRSVRYAVDERANAYVIVRCSKVVTRSGKRGYHAPHISSSG
jgi:hypothetical protein